MNALASVQGQARGQAIVQGQLNQASSLAWNPVPIPSSLQTSDISDVAICIFIKHSNPNIQYAALRYSPKEEQSTVFVDQVLLNTKAIGAWPKEVKWTRHVTEGSKQYLGILSYSYSTGDDPAAVTRIAFYDAYMVIGSLAGQLIKQPNTALPITCASSHGYLGSMAVPADTTITSWQPDGRWSNMIAIGCADGTLYFGDLSALQPNEVLMLDSASSAISVDQGAIKSLCWHHQAMSREILLVGCANGFSIVHTRNQKILMSPSDTHKRKNVSGVCWLENGNSVAVTYNDETASVPTGVLQLWDLRRSTHPYKEIPAHHQAGVIGLMRSNIDARFFCTVSTDGRVVTWAAFGSNAIPYADMSVQNPVKTFALLPCTGLVSVLAQETMYVLNLDANVVAENLKFSPQWILSNNSLAFGFGGKLAYLHNRVNPTNGQMESAAGVCDLPCDDTFVESVDVFVRYLSNNDLPGYCRMRSEEAENLGDPYEADIWSLSAAAFAPPNERSELLLKVLGYRPNNIHQQAQAFLGHPAGEGVIKSAERGGVGGVGGVGAGVGGGVGLLGSSMNSLGQEDSPTEHEAASFFDKLACTSANNDANSSIQNSNKMPDLATSENLVTRGGYVVDRNWSAGPLKLLKDLFLIGQPLGAIECAIQANDFGLAFMIACSLDNKMVLQTIKEKFVEFNKQSFVRVIAQCSGDDFESIVNCCEDPSEDWKEIASILVTYPMMQEVSMSGTTVEYQRLCCLLAQRLADDGDLMSAIPCYLVAGAYSQAAKLIANLPSTAGSQALKIIILRCLINQNQAPTEPDAQSAQAVQLFLTRLVNSGHIDQATSLLSIIGHDFPGTAHLRSLIDDTRGNSAASSTYQPVYELQPAPSYLAQCQQAQYQNTAMTQPGMAHQPGIAQPGAHNLGQPGMAQQGLGLARGTMQPAMHMGSVPLAPGGMPGIPPPPSMQPANPYGMSQPGIMGTAAHPPTAAKPLIPSMIPGMPQIPAPAQAQPHMISPPAVSGYNNPSSNPPATFTPPRPNSSYGQSATSSFNPQAPNPYAPPPPANAPHGAPPQYGGAQSQAFNPVNQSMGSAHMAAPQQVPGMPAMPAIPNLPGMNAGPRIMSPSIPAVPDASKMMPPSGGPTSNPSAMNMASNNIPRPAGGEEWPKSTHPAACVGGHIQPGMPTPWPLPTPAQGGRTAASEQFIQKVQDASNPTGVACSPADMNKIRSALDLAINRIPDAAKQPQVRAAVLELYKQLGEVAVSANTIAQLAQFADALNNQNLSMARDVAQVMISTSWHKNSKNWLTALKKLATPGTYQSMQASF